MSEPLQLGQAAGAVPEHLKSGDLLGKVVHDDDFVGVARIQADRTVTYGAGHGPQNKEDNNDGFSDMDLVASGAGAGNAGDPIEGDFRWAHYNDARRDDQLGVTGTRGSEDLRVSVSAPRTEKTLYPARHAPILPPPDGYLQLEFEADAGFDGYEIDPAASAHELGISYSRIPL